MRMPPSSPRRRSGAPAQTVRAVKSGHGGTLMAPPIGTNHSLYTDDNPLGAGRFRGQDQAAGRDRRLCPRPRTPASARSWPRSPASGRRCRSSAPTAPASATSGRWCASTSAIVVGEGDRMETGSSGAGGRVTYARYLDPAQWQGQVDEALRQALVNLGSVPAPAGEMTVVLGPGWPGVMLHEAIGHGLEGDFNRKKTSAFSGLIGAAHRVARRHRRRRRHDQGPPRLADRRRRGHAVRLQRPDRGRHPQGLHAGPPQRPAHGPARRPATAGARASPMRRCRA